MREWRESLAAAGAAKATAGAAKGTAGAGQADRFLSVHKYYAIDRIYNYDRNRLTIFDGRFPGWAVRNQPQHALIEFRSSLFEYLDISDLS